jgi:hypothetical protein
MHILTGTADIGHIGDCGLGDGIGGIGRLRAPDRRIVVERESEWSGEGNVRC